MDIQRELSGITAPLVTPFDESGAIDKDALKDLINALVLNGIDAVFPNGTTGEFASLSTAERQCVLKTVVEQVDGNVPVVAGAGATSIVETTNYIDEAAEIGADAAVIIPPYFHTANNSVGNQRYFKEVADQSSLPLLLYNIPSCTGQKITRETIERVATHENIIGLKDSSGDLEYFLAAMWATPDEFLLLQGYDALLAPALRMGADGGVNALSNVAPEVYAELYEIAETERGSMLQEAVSTLFEGCSTYGFAPATKAALEYRNIIPSDTVRPPLVTVSDEGRLTIKNSVNRVLEI